MQCLYKLLEDVSDVLESHASQEVVLVTLPYKKQCTLVVISLWCWRSLDTRRPLKPALAYMVIWDTAHEQLQLWIWYKMRGKGCDPCQSLGIWAQSVNWMNSTLFLTMTHQYLIPWMPRRHVCASEFQDFMKLTLCAADLLFHQEKLAKSIHYLISKEDQVRTQITGLELLVNQTEVRADSCCLNFFFSTSLTKSHLKPPSNLVHLIVLESRMKMLSLFKQYKGIVQMVI